MNKVFAMTITDALGKNVVLHVDSVIAFALELTLPTYLMRAGCKILSIEEHVPEDRVG
jgi:hypothetical protein